MVRRSSDGMSAAEILRIENEIASNRVDRDDPVLEARDIAAGWVSPHRQPMCDCHEVSPTYPVFRAERHVEPCPYFYIEKMGERIDELERIVDGRP